MFWSRPIVEEETRRWITNSFEWFESNFQPPTQPILPTKAFFKAPSGTDHKTAKLILNDIKNLLNFNQHVELQPLNILPVEYRHSYQNTSEIAGTYQQVGGTHIIHYNPEHMHHPIQLICTMAHEVMHAKLSGLESQMPGGKELHELSTDLACIIAGFGVFQMQSADDAGWSGYMRQPTRAYALAMFLNRRKLGIESVSAYLSSRCQKLLIRAFKEL